jgi:hypothetical protein
VPTARRLYKSFGIKGLIANYDSAISTAGWALGHPRDRSSVPSWSKGIYNFSQPFRPVLGPTQLIIWWTDGALPRLKRRRHETYHSLPVRSHVKWVEPLPQSPIRLHDVNGNNFISTIFNYLLRVFFWLPSCIFIIVGLFFFRIAIFYVFNPVSSVIYCTIIKMTIEISLWVSYFLYTVFCMKL